MNDLLLAGCQPIPLLVYLKALGLHRLVAEQADSDARGRWTPEGFRLTTALDRAAMEAFFLEAYVPTPIVAPWNGRSGFFAEKGRSTEQLLEELRAVDDARLRPLHQAITVGFDVHAEAARRGWDTKKDKEHWIAYCRNRFPDEGVEWLDAVAVLSDAGPVYPQILGGSGGVFGSMDLSNNWLEHLSAALSLPVGKKPAPQERSRRWLRDALDGTGTEGAAKAKVGQLDPGRAGGINLQSTDDKGGGATWVNPWDFVLALEGALLFASGVARRLGSQSQTASVAAMPFTVHATGAGHADAAPEETARGELWLPLWEQPTTLAELKRLFSEARAQWRGRQARTGLDFVQAVAALGTDRGITAFARSSVVQRLGQSQLVVPADRVRVIGRGEVSLLASADAWLDRIRSRGNRPGSVEESLRRVEAQQYQLASRGGPERLQAFLVALANLETTVADATRFRDESGVRPLRGLPAGAWLLRMDDGSPEFALACGLASLRDRWPLRSDASRVEQAHTLAACIRPVIGRDRMREWRRDPPLVRGFGSRPLTSVLADVLRVRARLTPEKIDGGERISVETRGAEPWFRFGQWIPFEVVEAFAGGGLDDDRIGWLLRGLLVLDWEWERPPAPGPTFARPPLPVPAWRLLAPFFAPAPLPLEPDHPSQEKVSGERSPHSRLRPESGWPTQLAAGRLDRVVRAAVQCLRVAGLHPAVASAAELAHTGEPRRVAAALLVHAPPRRVAAVLQALAGSPELDSREEAV